MPRTIGPAGRRRPHSVLLSVAIAFVAHQCVLQLSSQHPSTSIGVTFASAQNIAGKLASRPNLVEEGSKKKRRFLGGRKAGAGDNDAAEDGEWRIPFLGISVGGRRASGEPPEADSDSSWRWELFLAESRMILVSLVTSALCAGLSLLWLWYSKPGYTEEGGE